MRGRHQEGYFVKEVTIKDIEDLYEVRKALGILAAQMAVRNINSYQIKRLSEILKRHKELVQNGLFIKGAFVAIKLMDLCVPSTAGFMNKELSLASVLAKHHSSGTSGRCQLRYRCNLFLYSLISEVKLWNRETKSK